MISTDQSHAIGYFVLEYVYWFYIFTIKRQWPNFRTLQTTKFIILPRTTNRMFLMLNSDKKNTKCNNVHISLQTCEIFSLTTIDPRNIALTTAAVKKRFDLFIFSYQNFGIKINTTNFSVVNIIEIFKFDSPDIPTINLKISISHLKTYDQ